MALVARFEDLVAWQQARQLVKQIYTLTQKTPFERDFGLRDQMRRAAVSAMTNIAEGFDCESPLEFARFLEIARRSAVEVQSLLYTALDVQYLSKTEFETYYRTAQNVKAVIGGLRAAQFKRTAPEKTKPSKKSTPNT
ncbi:MAG: four helix bundle protein [Anaerolineales bacterium]